MAEPLARVSSEFTPDEWADLWWRWVRHQKPLRRTRLRDSFFAAGLVAVVLPVLFWWRGPEMPVAAVVAVTVLGCAVSFWMEHQGHGARSRRRVRRNLTKTRGEGPFRCNLELHRDGIHAHQEGNHAHLPWSAVEVIRDDHGDIEILAPQGAAVFGKGAFANDAEREAFLQLACKLAEEARRGA